MPLQMCSLSILSMNSVSRLVCPAKYLIVWGNLILLQVLLGWLEKKSRRKDDMNQKVSILIHSWINLLFVCIYIEVTYDLDVVCWCRERERETTLDQQKLHLWTPDEKDRERDNNCVSLAYRNSRYNEWHFTFYGLVVPRSYTMMI